MHKVRKVTTACFSCHQQCLSSQMLSVKLAKHGMIQSGTWQVEHCIYEISYCVFSCCINGNVGISVTQLACALQQNKYECCWVLLLASCLLRAVVSSWRAFQDLFISPWTSSWKQVHGTIPYRILAGWNCRRHMSHFLCHVSRSASCFNLSSVEFFILSTKPISNQQWPPIVTVMTSLTSEVGL